MKTHMTALIFALSASAFASPRSLFDLQFLPSKGTVFGITEASYRSTKIEQRGVDTNVKGYVLQQNLGYSFSDHFLLSTGFNFSELNRNPDRSPRTTRKGVSDPSLDGKLRLLDDDLILDVLAGGVISMGEHSHDVHGDTNNLQGGSSAYAGAQIGGKREKFQAAFTALYGRVFETTTRTSSAGSFKGDPYNTLNLNAEVLGRVMEKSFVKANGRAVLAESHRQIAASSIYGFGGEFQQLLTPNFLVRGGAEFAINNYRQGQIDDYDIWKFTVGANYQY